MLSVAERGKRNLEKNISDTVINFIKGFSAISRKKITYLKIKLCIWAHTKLTFSLLTTSTSKLDLSHDNLQHTFDEIDNVQNKLYIEALKLSDNAVKYAFNHLYIDDIYFRKYLYFQITTNTQYMYARKY